MGGVEVEYEIFRSLHPDAQVCLLAPSGGAARDVAQRTERTSEGYWGVDFAHFFEERFGSAQAEPESA
jgi:hypothetical protein